LTHLYLLPEPGYRPERARQANGRMGTTEFDAQRGNRMGRLDGHVALVTGAASGMGAAIAAAYAREGAKTLCVDVNDAMGEPHVKSLDGEARYVHLDVTSESDWAEGVARCREWYGPPTILAAVAGVGDGGAIADTTLDAWDRVIKINQTGVFLGMREVIPSMVEAGHGSIVNLSSTDGIQGGAGQLAYVASKFAVRGMTKSAALELGEVGIRVNSIHPGFIDTPMLASARDIGLDIDEMAGRLSVLHRMGTPEEVASLAVYLASDESSYCTGAEFVIDGGMTAGYNTGVFFGTPTAGLGG
jgi:3alpha(or 20beta)-hydroxysteroid dehydrogenase